MKAGEFLETIGKNVNDNKGGILTTATVLGIGVTTALTVLSTIKIKKKIDDNNGVIDKEMIPNLALDASPALIAALLTMGCAVGAHKSDMAKYAVLAGLYASDSKKLEELTDKYRNKITVEKDGTVKNLANKKEDEVVTKLDNKELEKKTRMYDAYLDKFVDCSIKDIIEAKDRLNQELNKNSLYDDSIGVYLSDGFYDYLDIDARHGDAASMGFMCEDGPIDIVFGAELDENFQTYYTFTFNTKPRDIDDVYSTKREKWRRY